MLITPVTTPTRNAFDDLFHLMGKRASMPACFGTSPRV